jgi:uncharacterized protein (TIGR02996 family)
MEAELIAAIAAAPDDDEPRLVYADALMQRGDPRGELVALQCRIARADAADEPIDEAVLSRERELRETHGVLWLAPLREIVDAGYVFRRGFVEHVSTWSESDVCYWKAIDVEELRYPTPPPAGEPHDRLARLVEAAPLLRSIAIRGDVLYCELGPEWRRFTTVELFCSRANVERIQAFVRAPELAGVRRLQLTNTEASDDQARAWLGLSQPLEHLGFHAGLNVTSRPTCDVGSLIADNPALRDLRSLHLGGFVLADARPLARLAKLERLAIHRIGITARDLIDLVSKLPALTMLELDNDDAQLGVLDVTALLEAAPNLMRLAIRCGIQSKGARALAKSEHARTLRRLELDQCKITDADAQLLLGSAQLAGVGWWHVIDDQLTVAGRAAFAARQTLRYEPPIPAYPAEVVEHLPSHKINAIKAYRARTRAGLADSKMEVERINEELTREASFGINRSMTRWCRP